VCSFFPSASVTRFFAAAFLLGALWFGFYRQNLLVAASSSSSGGIVSFKQASTEKE
jgi:hypothetical protein